MPEVFVFRVELSLLVTQPLLRGSTTAPTMKHATMADVLRFADAR